MMLTVALADRYAGHLKRRRREDLPSLHTPCVCKTLKIYWFKSRDLQYHATYCYLQTTSREVYGTGW